jgi:hypothetical protein
VTKNVQLLRRCAEDAKRDEKQWAALSGELDPVAEVMETGVGEGFDTLDAVFQSGNIGDATRLIEVSEVRLELNRSRQGQRKWRK